MSEKLRVLEQEMSDAQQSFYRVEARRYVRKGELENEVREKLQREYGAEMEAAQRTARAAEEAYRKAKAGEMEADSLKDMPYPEGTWLYYWDRRGFDGRPYMTRKIAVMQVYRDGDQLPVSMRYGRPLAGVVVLRELKKSRVPGAAVKLWVSCNKDSWLPEGVKPKGVS